jgi:uncharacterized protein (DUF58 family)
VTSNLLDLPSLLRLKNLHLLARAVAEGALAGLHKAAHHGSSVEFAEHKEYAPGDDLRHIDWRAYGRIDKYYVKRFEEETELRGYVVLDVSGSMGYGRENQISKLQFAGILAASLAYLLLRQNDPAGLLLVGENAGDASGRSYIPARHGGAHLGDLCRAIEETEAGGRSTLGEGLTFLSELLRRRSLILVLSDLLPSPPMGDAAEAQATADYVSEQGALLRARLCGLRAQKHDVIVLHVLDNDELELPFSSLTWFEDTEPGREGPARLFVDPADLRSAYKAEIERFLTEMRRGLREGDVEYHLLTTSRSPESVLLDILRGPLRRRVRR